MKEPGPLQQADRTFVRVGRRKLSYFSGCDYFRLASHPRVLAALREGVGRHSFNVAASRVTTGNHRLYRQCETALARFFCAPEAVLVSTGYLTNLVVAQALAGQFSHALVDQAAHPSLVEASRFLDCPVLKFESRSARALGETASRCGPGARLIVLTDGMFARDGSVAPLSHYLRVLPSDAALLVDDAHGAGVLGRTGQGTLEHAGISRARVIQTITLSKAFGCYGGAVLCSARLRQQIWSRSTMFAGSTPMPLPVVGAALAAMKLLAQDPAFRSRLHDKAEYLKCRLRLAGQVIPPHPGPIIPVFPRNPAHKKELGERLRRAAIFPPLIQYPGAPAGGFFRFVISSEHSDAQIDALASVLERI